MKSNEYLIYTNSLNQSIEFGWDYDMYITKFSDSMDNTINTTKLALQDGEEFNSSTLEKRAISITIEYPISKAEELEKIVKRTIDMKHEGILTKVIGKDIYKIKVRPSCIPEVTRKKGIGSMLIEFDALSSYYYQNDVTELLANKVPMFRFPHYFDEDKAFATIVEVLNPEFENKGDVETGFNVIFKCTNGTVTNPSIINHRTGEKIVLNIVMNKGDVVEIVNNPFDKRIYVNGVKQFSALNRKETKFFTIVVGINTFGINADENVMNLQTYIKYTPKYL